MTPRCHCTIETIVFSSAGWPKRPTVYVRPSNTLVECCRLSPRRRERPQHDKDGYLAVPGQAIKCGRRPMTREEIEHKMDELARENCKHLPNRSQRGTAKCHGLKSVTVLSTVESPNMLFQPPKSRAFVCTWRLWEGEKA